jgi:glyoxylase-like metal-dependent hydrolase (beta-lactamase superfamily II)
MSSPRRAVLWGVPWLALCTMMPGAGVAQTGFRRARNDGRDVRMTEVAKGVYQFTTMRDGYTLQLNSVVVVNERDVLVFDTGTRPSTALVVLSGIRKLTDKPVRYVVNSDGYPDHWAGNQVYADTFPGVEIVATRETTEYMRKTASIWPLRVAGDLQEWRTELTVERSTGRGPDGESLSEDQIRQDESDLSDFASLTDEARRVRPIFPTLTFSDSLRFRHGGRDFLFLSVTGDAKGTAVLYLPGEGVLITGDAVSYPIPRASARPGSRVASLKRLIAIDAEVIVPGRGPALHDNAFAVLELRLLESVVDGVDRALAAGVTELWEMQMTVKVEELRESFTHGDAGLDAWYTACVKGLVASEMAMG